MKSEKNAIALDIAAKYVAGNSVKRDDKALAQYLGVTVNALSAVRYGHRKIPPRWAPRLERLTNHELRAEDLCPDIDWLAVFGRD